MKVVIAPDSFKGSVSASQACEAIAEGVRRVQSGAEIILVPMADGGEGTVEALVSSTGGRLRKVRVRGPLSGQVEAEYGILGGDSVGAGDSRVTAVIEMAQAAGLTLIAPDKRNPLHTTTYGLGEIILDALEHGCRDFIIGIGGSGTNDCGCGMAQALGVRFLDGEGGEITRCITGELAGEVASIDISKLETAVKESSFVVACDVDNPLLGARGATYVYGRQKGADEEGLKKLEANLTHIIGIIEGVVQREVRKMAGAGAAGGLGAGLTAFLSARLEKGVQIVMEYCRFKEQMRDADLIITGEGQIDGSTVYGKTIAGVAGAAKDQSIPVIALAGAIGPEAHKVFDIGVSAVLPICPGPVSLEEAMSKGREFLADAAERVLRLAGIFLKSEVRNPKSETNSKFK